MTLWQHRMGAPPADALLSFTESLSIDERLWREDLEGSRAHVEGLHHAGLLDDDELETLLGALRAVEAELGEGTFVVVPSDEDIHTAIERRVTELAGDVGAKLHTGRSRNDQVATDLRLWARDALAEVAGGLIGFADVLRELAESAGSAVMPGYTHLQRAQPIPVAQWLLAHAWAVERDIARVLDALVRMDVSPLGAGALAGSTLPLDPPWVAARLGFSRSFANSVDAVSDRDFVAEGIFAITMAGVHLSRLAEEIVLFTTEEFRFIRLDDAYATGSSMLPQKKNPDIAELSRAKAGRYIGDLVTILTVLKGLPLTYNRDLQEDKQPLFDAVDQFRLELSAMQGLLATMTFDFDAMRQAASSAYLQAIDVAEYLVRRGMPFRRAHAVAAGLVRDSLERHVALAELVAAHPQLGEEAVRLIEAHEAIERRGANGMASLESVRRQLDELRVRLGERRERLHALRHTRPA
ncbi:argininosuccinate lyase [Acidimicrobium ferrooxidans DSM 10331]|uniref:Argininosuccinate lyase n=1 Tax=Acidimicrobium ferrooxidans (strain DSM 10331 / JCM 15462 / NBRC 103882 / ICP) TaxID=525909 RepID=C7M0R6_ACIFD|nr:argininosuccinate lyase [Acidimicrobium ferrooxidans]ACU54574.1 argininosuccinate lyase [Acidimicrobium ferrooxidans DSM 10331]